MTYSGPALRAEYEYVVVGSGAGGGPVAANLARAGRSVLLLEAGGPPEKDDYACEVPAFHTLASEKETMSWRFFVRHYEDEGRQRGDTKYRAQDGGVFYPRAGTLGGCTAHNAMIFVCPSNRDWDAIADLTGDESWRAARMRRYLERIEDCRYRRLSRHVKRFLRWNPSRHGFAGWLSTEQANPKLIVGDDELFKLVKRSSLSAFFGLTNPVQRLKSFFTTLLDPNDWRALQLGLEGIRLTPLSTARGRRVGTRQLLLNTQQAHPDRLTIKTGALATRVLFEDGNRAVGVEYLEGDHVYRADPCFGQGRPGVRREVKATREVILAGGSFNTPQLLQLSGIGPASLLQQHGIPVRVDLPGVGANLQDRYEVSLVYRMKRPFELLEGAVMRPPGKGEEPDRYLRQWIDAGQGIYTTNGSIMSILRKSSRKKRDPDLLIFGLVTDFRGYRQGYSSVVSASHQYFTWAILKGYTQNTAGSVTIRSPNPQDVPQVSFRYFEEGTGGGRDDLEAVAGAVDFVRRMTARYDHLIEREEFPGHEKVRTPDEIRQFVRNEAWGHHASGTCKIGRADDPMAVLDSSFRVRGTKGLRVVDASVFPRIPGLFIVSAVYMAAEKASDVILSDGA
jgi:choline dehydrogenase